MTKIDGEDYTLDYHNRGSETKKAVAPALANIVTEFYSPNSVVDLGCGLGIFLKEFEERGLEVKGYEYSPQAIENNAIDKSKLEEIDLSEKQEYPKKWGVALCIEVIEHIDKEQEDTVIENITKASDKIIFSGAVQGQPGFHHVNCRPKDYWIKKFRERGFEIQKGKTLKLRKELVNTGSCPPYLANNPMVFEKD